MLWIAYFYRGPGHEYILRYACRPTVCLSTLVVFSADPQPRITPRRYCTVGWAGGALDNKGGEGEEEALGDITM